MIVNIYAPNIEAPKYIKQILTELKGEINSNTIIVGDFSTHLSTKNGSSRQKTSKEIVDLNNTVCRLYGSNRHISISHQTAKEYTLLSSTHGTFAGINHMLGHKTSLKKFKKDREYNEYLLQRQGIKLEINNRKKAVKFTNT